MHLNELIKYKNMISEMSKYYAVCPEDPLDDTGIVLNELDVDNKNKQLKNVVDGTLLFYEKEILSLAGQENFDIIYAGISLYLVADKSDGINFIDDCILVKPYLMDENYEQVATIPQDNMLPYVVSYNDFFAEMNKNGYEFNIVPYEELKKYVFANINGSSNIDSKSLGFPKCEINFNQKKL